MATARPGSQEELGQTALSPGAAADVTAVPGPCPGSGTASLPSFWPHVPGHSLSRPRSGLGATRRLPPPPAHTGYSCCPPPAAPPPGLPHERGSVSLPLCLHMNLGWECRSVGPGILVLLTFALRIRGAWASRDNPCVFFSGQLKGESGYFQGLSSGTGWLYLPWRVATCRVSGCREAPVNSQGRLGAALCVPPQEDVCVRVRERVCKSVCMCEGVCWGRRIPLFLGIP